MIVKEYVNQPGKKISYKLDFDIFSIPVEHEKTTTGVTTTDLDELFEWLEEQYGFDYVDIVEKFVDFQNYLLLYGVAFELNMAPEERSQKEIEEYADKVFNPTLDNYMKQLEERIKSQQKIFSYSAILNHKAGGTPFKNGDDEKQACL